MGDRVLLRSVCRECSRETFVHGDSDDYFALTYCPSCGEPNLAWTVKGEMLKLTARSGPAVVVDRSKFRV